MSMVVVGADEITCELSEVSRRQALKRGGGVAKTESTTGSGLDFRDQSRFSPWLGCSGPRCGDRFWQSLLDAVAILVVTEALSRACFGVRVRSEAEIDA